MSNDGTVGIRQLKNELSRFVERVRRGQEVTITDRGTVVARLVPPRADDRIEKLIAEGLIERAPSRRTVRPRRARVRLRGRGRTMAEYVRDGRG